MITPANLHTADIKLALLPRPHRFAFGIENVTLSIRHGPADRHNLQGTIALAGPMGDINGGFSWTVKIVERDIKVAEKQLLQMIGQSLAAAENMPDGF